MVGHCYVAHLAMVGKWKYKAFVREICSRVLMQPLYIPRKFFNISIQDSHLQLQINRPCHYIIHFLFFFLHIFGLLQLRSLFVWKPSELILTNGALTIHIACIITISMVFVPQTLSEGIFSISNPI